MGRSGRSGTPEDAESHLDQISDRVRDFAQLTVSLVASRASVSAHPETQRELLDLIQRLAALWQAPTRALESPLVEMKSLLSERLSAVLAEQEPKGVRGRVEGSELVLPLDLAARLNLAVNEALLNCLKHAFPGGRAGRIVVTIEKALKDGAVVSISDDGVGIGSDAGLEESSRGGAIMRRLAEQIGATIEAASQPGQGTTVRFRFPLSR